MVLRKTETEIEKPISEENENEDDIKEEFREQTLYDVMKSHLIPKDEMNNID